LTDSIGQPPATADRVRSAIASAAAKTGVNFDFLVDQARVESGMNPKAQARTSSATGLYQFTKQTWLSTVKAHGASHELGWASDAISQGAGGQLRITDPALRQAILDLRTQPEAASAMAAELASDNSDFLTSETGHAPENVDLYLAHFLGAAGAARFITGFDANPDSSAAPAFPEAATANRSVFFRSDGTARSYSEIRALLASRLNSKSVPFEMQTRYAAGFAASASLAAPASASLALAGIDRSDMPQLRSIEPMPQRISLDFARQAYQRLAGLGQGFAG
jgi:Transglycosylase SLT domain